MNAFAITIIMLFLFAAVFEAINGRTAAMLFYFFSAAINACVIFMR